MSRYWLRAYLFSIVHLIALVNCRPVQNERENEGGLVLTNPSAIKPNSDPRDTVDIVEKALANEFSAEMVTNRTRAVVNCENGEILVKLNFTEPFRGVAYADFDRSSPCGFTGDGQRYYEMRLPLKGCGTRQEAERLFRNDIILRFHRSLELEEDEVKTIICRYPPPEVPTPPPPPAPPAKLLEAPREPAKLTQYEPMVIIAALLFFALLLAGLGTTTYMTRNQTIKDVNTPLPITSMSEYDTYVDSQSIIDTEDVIATQKIVTLPKISSHLVEDVFKTNIHEIETHEDLVHHRQVVPRPHVERIEYDDAYYTNQDEIIEQETLRQRKLADQRNFNKIDCDDAYITNQDELLDEETLTSQKMHALPSKLEIRTIEDTFLTKVEEVVQKEDTTYLKNLADREEHDEQRHHEELSYLEYREGYRED